MPKLPKPTKENIIKSGRQARRFRDEEDRRVYGPWKVRMEVQMSKLSVVSDTLEFFVYQATGDMAVDRAGYLLKAWYVARRIPFTGYPKPVGFGAAIPCSDEEFRKTWQQAVNSGWEIERAGVQDDPVAFHIKPKSKIIIT